MKQDFEMMELKVQERGMRIAVEPSYVVEFNELSSRYLLEDKDDSEAISSNAEF